MSTRQSVIDVLSKRGALSIESLQAAVLYLGGADDFESLLRNLERHGQIVFEDGVYFLSTQSKQRIQRVIDNKAGAEVELVAQSLARIASDLTREAGELLKARAMLLKLAESRRG